MNQSAEEVPADPALLEKWRQAALWAGVAAGSCGAVALLNWLIEGPHPDPSLQSMKIDTAFGMTLCGLALALDRLPGREPLARAARLAVGSFAVLLAARSLGFDLRLTGPFPTMLPATAVSFCGFAAGFLLQDAGAKVAVWLGQFLLHVLAVIPLLALMGYLAGFQSLLAVAGMSRMAPSTSACFLALCVGALLARPRLALMRVVSSETMGGMMARRLIPYGVLGPVFIGLLCLLGQRLGYYDLGLGIGLFIAANTLAIVYVIWLTAERILEFDLERRRLEASSRHAAELEARNREMEEMNRLRNRFLAHMGHEIRTPMNGVIGAIDTLAGSDLDPRQRRLLELASKSADSLARVVDDVLDFSRLEAGRLELEAAPFDLRKSVERALAPIVKEAEAKGLPVELRISPAVPDALLGDEARLTQALANLADNAVKFTERGSVRVEIALLEADPANALLRFSVSDTGAGIPPEKSRQVFEAFSQADGSIDRVHAGTGLGLAIVSRIVALLGGTVDLRSEPGQGSTFAFTARLQRQAAPRETLERTGHGYRILLVEDNEVNRELASGILESAGFSVSLAFNGRQAVEVAAREPFDLILMDLQLPGMDGLEATAAIRAGSAGPVAPILALTAHATREHREACAKAGMQGFLAKPVRPRQLLEAVFDALGVEAPAAGARRQRASAGEQAVDLSDALEMTGGDPHLLARVIKTFLTEKEALVAELDAGIELRDACRIERGAHKLRGSMLIFGANQAAATLERIERLCSLGNHEGIATERALLERCLGQIESELGEFKEGSAQ